MEKVAFVTGAAKRLGKIIAIKLASLGYNIVLHYHQSEKEVLETQNVIIKLGRKAIILQGNLNNLEIIPLLLQQAKREMGQIDLLVNNASCFYPDRFSDLQFSHLQEQLTTNAFAPLLLAQEFTKLTKTGEIINLVDSRIRWNDTQYFSYSLSKMMLANMTKMLAKELYPNFRINAIAPGAILAPEKEIDLTITGNKPLKGIDRTPQIESTIEFLIKNDYINGEIIYVDGGLQLR